jgi:predicted nucleic acid-binding protein
MKTLVDTCIWSLALRRKKSQLSEVENGLVSQLNQLIQGRSARIIGPIRQELLSGIRDSGRFSELERLMDPFRDEEIFPADYVEAARLFNLCRSKGVESGPTDILICTIAIRLGYAILTNDRGLVRCVEALRASGLKF